MPGFSAAYGLLASILVCTGLGYALDRVAETSPWGLLGGSLIGFGAGMYSLYKALTKPPPP